MRYEKDEFGAIIGKLLKYTGAKNFALASELGYDVSYISKMINGKIYPASRNVSVICHKTALFITENATASARRVVSEALDIDLSMAETPVDEKNIFREALEDYLLHSYFDTVEGNVKSNNKMVDKNANKAIDSDDIDDTNSYTLVSPTLRKKYLRMQWEKFNNSDEITRYSMMTCFFELNRDDKLALAAVSSMDFDINPNDALYKLLLSFNLSECKNIISDTLIFTCMVMNFACPSFKLYATEFPCQSLMFSAINYFCHFDIPGPDGKCLIATSSHDKKTISDTYDAIEELISAHCHIVLSEQSPAEFILDKNYMRSLLGENLRMYFGKMNEFFLPEDIFARLSAEVFGDGSAITEELNAINVMINKGVYGRRMQILLYASALEDYALTGQLYFFNKAVQLSVEDRMAHIQNMLDVLEACPNIKLRLVSEPFVDELRNEENATFILSDNLGYLRVSERFTEYTMLVISERDVKQMYHQFFEAAWEMESKLIIAKEDVEKEIKKSLQFYNV